MFKKIKAKLFTYKIRRKTIRFIKWLMPDIECEPNESKFMPDEVIEVKLITEHVMGIIKTLYTRPTSQYRELIDEMIEFENTEK